jgi:hypothetical protein
MIAVSSSLGRTLVFLHGIAAVDDDHLAGDIAGTLAGEEGRDMAHLIGGSRPPGGEFLPAVISCFVEDAVAIQPGATALTVMPKPATSMASARVMPTMAALAAL